MRIKGWLFKLIPRIYNCDKVIFIRWMDNEYIIQKR